MFVASRRLACRKLRHDSYEAERLEARRLLSTITWTNRGILSGANTDNVNQVFGVVVAGQVRPIIDAALTSWSRVISNFNYPGGGNNYNISIKFADAGTSNGANAGSATLASDGKPLTGTMTIGRGGDTDGDGLGDGGGYFLDPSPFDLSEFQAGPTTAFSGYAAPGSVAAGLGDLYEIILHELGHALGHYPSPQVQALTTDTGVGDTINSNPAKANYWRFDSANVHTLLTGFDSGGQSGSPFDAGGGQHHAPVGASVTVGAVTYVGSDDLMTAFYGAGQRRLISYNDAYMLGDAYGYTIATPASFGSFYGTLDSDGTLRISAPSNASSDTLVLTGSGSTLTLNAFYGSPIAGIDTPSITTSFNANAVQRISINGGDGTDYLRLENTLGKPVTVNGGEGDDFIDFGFTNRNLGLISANTVLIGGGGFDQVFVYDNNTTTPQTYTLTNTRFDRPGWGGFNVQSGIEATTLNTGTAADVVNILSTASGRALYTNSAAGQDIVNVGNVTNGVQSILSNIEVRNAPSFTTLNINDNANAVARSATFDITGSLGYVIGLAPAVISWANADLGSVTLTTGTGSDVVSVDRLSRPATIKNAGGPDTIAAGNDVNGMQSITGTLFINGTPYAGQTLLLDDTANTVGRATVYSGTTSNANKFLTGLAPAQITLSDSGAVTLLQGGGSDSFTVSADVNVPLNVYGNAGNDGYIWNLSNSHSEGLGGSFTTPITFDGGADFNSLSVNDTARATANYSLFPHRFYSVEPVGFQVGADFNFDRMGAIGIALSSNPNTFNVYGVSTDIAPGNQITVDMGGGANVANVYPRDATGNLTINDNIGIGGGSGVDTMYIQDAASAAPIHYSFSNPFGPGTQDVFGVGAGAVGTAGIESWVINAGSGDDTFDVNQWTGTPTLTVNANGGNDSIDYSPAAKNLPANFNATSVYTFAGGPGTDTIGLHNDNSTGGFYYYLDGGLLRVTSLLGTPNFGLYITQSGVESTTATGGSGADSAQIVSSLANTSNAFNLGTGNDSFAIGYPLHPSRLTSVIQSQLFVDGGGGANDSLQIYNEERHRRPNASRERHVHRRGPRRQPLRRRWCAAIRKPLGRDCHRSGQRRGQRLRHAARRRDDPDSRERANDCPRRHAHARRRRRDRAARQRHARQRQPYQLQPRHA